jgi:hypothetical protein
MVTSIPRLRKHGHSGSHCQTHGSEAKSSSSDSRQAAQNLSPYFGENGDYLSC